MKSAQIIIFIISKVVSRFASQFSALVATSTLIFSFGISAFATTAVSLEEQFTEQIMTTISNDRNKDINQLSALVDGDGSLRGLSYAAITAEGLQGSRFVKSFTLEQVASARGVVLDGDSGHDVFILQGRLESRLLDSSFGQAGGTLTFKYLTNGLTGTYASCQIGIRRSPQGKWYVVNTTTNQAVVSASIETWSLGISAVEGLCPKVF
jgi:hypothetical protein